jgi:hypothetical protein
VDWGQDYGAVGSSEVQGITGLPGPSEDFCIFKGKGLTKSSETQGKLQATGLPLQLLKEDWAIALL